MKKIIYRKLLSDCLIFFCLALLGISAIIWVFQAVNFLDIIIDDGRNYNVYLSYSLLNFPKIISRVLPFALFFSFSYTFIKYEAQNELIIFWNHGESKLTVINFFFFISILIMLIQILILSFLVPKSQEIARSKLRSSDVDYFEGLIKPKKFNDTIKGLTIYSQEKNIDGEFKNIYIKKNSTDKNFQITFAKKGVFELRNNKKILVLYDGRTLNSRNNKITNFDFSKSDFGLSNMNSHLVIQQKIQEQSTYSLFYCLYNIYISEKKIRLLNCELANPTNVYKELFKRLINPLYLPLLVLISLHLIMTSKENPVYIKKKYFIFAVGFAMIIFSESSIGYITNKLINNAILISLPFIFIVIFYLYFFYRLNFNDKKI
ncbi:LptF/LptG family permease [Candidatus Pelagibacter bacterium nBUS_27]|uniref:LptF/LptG family permease n=1 Tax=Candidatus Pelagibacter bacterium nBUS_27 TaxID=3374188 RepID=UPI003EBADA62